MQMKVNVLQEQQVLTAIATRASTPLERQYGRPQGEAGTGEHRLQVRLQRLYTCLGIADEETKQRFLAQCQLDEQQFTSFLSSQRDEASLKQHHWIEQLERVLNEFAPGTHNGTGSSSYDRAFFSDDPIPFEHILLPFVRFARHQLSLRTTSSAPLLSDEVLVSLEHWLLGSLSQWASSALQLEFTLFRKQRLWASPSPEDERRRDLYEKFQLQYQGKGLLLFFQEYSVLARLLMLLVEQWVEACGEFVQRLKDDLEEITHLFYDGQPLGSVIALKPGCSDPHHRGRSVFLVQFSTGLKLVYKPRSLAMDQAFFALLSWCHNHGLSPHLKTLKVLSRPTYGWMEYVEQVPCTSIQEVRNYYLRAGMLLCLLYVLGGTDMHQENLVACGEYPVLIDLEMVVNPGTSPLLKYKATASHIAFPGEIYEQTVLHIGLLPAQTAMKGIAQSLDISGLGRMEEPASLQTTTRWMHINTDAMHLCQTTHHLVTQGEHTVVMQETPVNPALYTQEMMEGFRQLYHFLLNHRRELLASEGPLATFEHCPLRIVLRKTATYVKSLLRLKNPKFLREEADRWIELQRFKRPLQTALAEPRLMALAEAEIAALEQLDIPWFGTTFESYDIQTDTGQTIKNSFPLSAGEGIRARLLHLDEDDLQRQTQLIRASFQAATSTQAVVKEELPDLTAEQETHDVLVPTELLAVARQIGHTLSTLAFPYAQENKGWVGFQRDPSSESLSLQPLGFDLYDGVCGITLFLAALDHITGEQTYSHLIASALQPLCQHVREAVSSPTKRLQSQWSIGGATGLGSFLYAFTQIGTWQHRPELLEVARQAASLITEPRIRADQSLDIMGGCAGTILGLLTLYKQVGEESLLKSAMLCGHHLLEQRVKTTCGARAWSTLQKQPLTGFSHGVAGIAYALLLLAQATGQSVYKEAAEEALRFEQHHFSPEAGNWPDLRENLNVAEGSAMFTTSWCHGAPGIGLARLGGLTVLDTPQVRSDLQVALQTTQAYSLAPLDNLCCGNYGRIELLVAASQRLQQPQLLKVARQRTSALVQRATRHGGFRVLAQLPRQAFNPGLFQGYAGIGYQLLRVAFPEQVPSVLLWQ
jgi:type 2 lantibiotic biosynthesis protein LanM